MNFKSSILIVPGLGNSGDNHWQTIWQKEYGFTRVEQEDWETPHCKDWVDTLDAAVNKYPKQEVILVGHSLACITIAFWAAKYNCNIKGALLVAPSDTEAATYPEGTSGFTPVPLLALPFPSVVVASTNDYYVTLNRAEQFAKAWGSTLTTIGEAGHINTTAGFGEWPEGLKLLKQLDN